MEATVAPMDRVMTPVVGIFDDTSLFTRYRVKATFVDLVLGGVPQKPEIIEAWLRTRIEGGDQELKLMMAKTYDDLDIELPGDPSVDDLIAASKKVAAARNGNTFRRDDNGLFLASYQVKAMLKESTNILYAGERWGVTKKGPKSFLAERVFVDEQRVYLGRSEPDGTLTQVGHVMGPKGPRSTLTYIDYCVQPTVEFTLSSLRDCITQEQWRDILRSCQDEGIGALRSMAHGRFKVTEFSRV